MKNLAKQNDLFRSTMILTPYHRVVLTQGVATSPDREAIVTAVRAFNEFSKDNDPYGEHDFGKLSVNGKDYFFKIDYYDVNFEYGADTSSPDPFARVLTIMRSDEY